MEVKRRILPTIVTTDGSYLEKLEEVNQLGLEEISFFSTCLRLESRKSFYLKLRESCLKKIPFVHLKDDTELWEIEYFLERFKTEVFNIHSSLDYPISRTWLKYKNMIFIENTVFAWSEEELVNFAGVCLDFSHLEDSRLLRREIYKKNIKILGEYFIGCGHISAVGKKLKHSKELNLDFYSQHFFRDFWEFDYLKNYPKKYFPRIIALELENPIKEQLRVKEYIEKILG